MKVVLKLSNLFLILMNLLCIILQLNRNHIHLLIQLFLTIFQHRYTRHLIFYLFPEFIDQLVLAGLLLRSFFPHSLQFCLNILIPKIKLLNLLSKLLNDRLLLPDSPFQQKYFLFILVLSILFLCQ